MPPSGVDYASEFLNGYAPEYVINRQLIREGDNHIGLNDNQSDKVRQLI